MATITTAQDGKWGESSTWTGGVVPTEADTAIISHTVEIYGLCKAQAVALFEGGGLITDPDTQPEPAAIIPRLYTDAIIYRLDLAPAPFRLDGVIIRKLDGSPLAFIGNQAVQDGTWGYTEMLQDGANGVIIDDTGIFNASATLQDIKPEGSGRAYARKIGNAVRYLTLTVRIARSEAASPVYVRYLYQWAEGPAQVIASNGSCVIKGYIESVVYDKNSVGTAYHVLQVTIAEGQQ